MKTEFHAQMLQIFFGEKDVWRDKPMHEALVEKCTSLGIAGATVCRGIEGYGASSTIHRSSLWSFSRDSPMVVTIIDTPEQIAKLKPALETMVTEGLVLSMPVEAVRYHPNREQPGKL